MDKTKVKLQHGKKHAQDNGATHHRDGDIYRVTSRVKCWECGKWVDCNDYWDLESWLMDLTPINFNDVE